jgi:hypothetical protein
VDILDFIFRLGVVFAIYGFLWGLMDIALRLLTGGRQRSLGEIYVLKAIKYFLLVDVTFLFCIDENQVHLVVMNQVIIAGIVLLTYFLGKLKNSQNRTAVFQMMRAGQAPNVPKAGFNLKAEIGLIVASLIFFILFWFFPEIASNAVSRWFHESILNIEDTPIFGFIFKIIGFFFLVSLIFKMINALTFLLNGGKLPGSNGRDNNGLGGGSQQKNDDQFADYEEVD